MMKLLIVFLIITPATSFAWGKTGHRIVAQIASEHLHPGAKLKLQKLMGTEDLPESSVWPDRIKSDPKLRKQYNHWHYLNCEKGKKIEERKKQKDGDILTAIDHFSDMLKNKKNSKEQRQLALRFLVHLIGDLHQPLHTGYADDKGGNSIKLKWFSQESNLHQIWDEDIIDFEKLSYTEYSKKLNKISKKEISKLQKSLPLDWANETRDYLEKVYDYKQEKYWEYDYVYKHLNFINERLLKAGIRLAGHLNKLLSI